MDGTPKTSCKGGDCFKISRKSVPFKGSDAGGKRNDLPCQRVMKNRTTRLAYEARQVITYDCPWRETEVQRRCYVYNLVLLARFGPFL